MQEQSSTDFLLSTCQNWEMVGPNKMRLEKLKAEVAKFDTVASFAHWKECSHTSHGGQQPQSIGRFAEPVVLPTLIAGLFTGSCRRWPGIHRMNSVMSSTFSMNHCLRAPFQRAPSLFALSFSENGTFRKVIIDCSADRRKRGGIEQHSPKPTVKWVREIQRAASSEVSGKDHVGTGHR